MKRQMFFSSPMAIVVAVVLFQSSAVAQPGGGRGGPGFGGPGGFGGGGILGLAARDDVQQELQLVDEQQEELTAVAEEIRNEIGQEMRDMFSQMRDLGDDERRERFEEIRARLEEANADAEKRLEKVLLPHQFERLKQIDLQSRLQQRGAAALTSGELADTLNLTDDQRAKLEQRAEEVQQELEEKIQQLRIEARNKLLDVLTAEQRAKLESLMGDDFALVNQGPGFGRRGGFFRFGGDRDGEGRGEGRRGPGRGRAD
jgi:Spy/CpxP family protein refolding chaperone